MTDRTQTEALLPSRETLMAQAQVFASAWAIAGSSFDSGDGMEVAEQEKAILADMTRRLHARIAELEAVGAGGVQALSAAPAIAKLRHLYQNMVNGAVRDTASAKRIAEGLLAPAIEALERATPPAEQTFITPETGNSASAKGAAITSESGTPPAEQQAAPKAAPGEPLTRDQIREVFMAHGFTVKEGHTDLKQYVYDAAYALIAMGSAPKTAPGVGNSGFDHQTAADFLSGKTVSDEAVREFVATSRWAHDERAALSATLLAMHGVLTSREAEIALLKKALLEAETAPQPAPAPLSEPIDQVERALAIIGVVGAIDGHDVVRRESVLEIARRAALAAQGGKDA